MQAQFKERKCTKKRAISAQIYTNALKNALCTRVYSLVLCVVFSWELIYNIICMRLYRYTVLRKQGTVVNIKRAYSPFR